MFSLEYPVKQGSATEKEAKKGKTEISWPMNV